MSMRELTPEELEIMREEIESMCDASSGRAAGSSAPACLAPCPKCGSDKVLLRYIAPQPAYSGGSFVRNTNERLRHTCERCEYAWDSKPNAEAHFSERRR